MSLILESQWQCLLQLLKWSCSAVCSATHIIKCRSQVVLGLVHAVAAAQLRLCDRRRTSCGDEAAALSSSSASGLARATSSLEMLPRQNGQAGDGGVSVAGFGLLWQHSASVHAAHIWCPQSSTSMLHACSKQMQHSSASLACHESAQMKEGSVGDASVPHLPATHHQMMTMMIKVHWIVTKH